jgi:hypothetical protein
MTLKNGIGGTFGYNPVTSLIYRVISRKRQRPKRIPLFVLSFP